MTISEAVRPDAGAFAEGFAALPPMRPVALVDARPAGRGFVAHDPAQLSRRAAEPPQPGAAPEPAHEETGGQHDYTRGFSDGYAAARAELEKEKRELLALLSSAEAFAGEPSEELTMLIGETVEHLVARVFDEQMSRPEWMQKAIEDAVAVISECDDARTLRLHPDDAALVEPASIPLEIVTDTAVPRGSVRIECSSGWVENGKSQYLKQLRTALGRREHEA